MNGQPDRPDRAWVPVATTFISLIEDGPSLKELVLRAMKQPLSHAFPTPTSADLNAEDVAARLTGVTNELTDAQRREAAQLARVAQRPDIAATLDADPHVTGSCVNVASVLNPLYLYLRLNPDLFEVELHTWNLADERTVYALVTTLVDRAGGDADVSQTIVVTEYKLTDPEVLTAVIALTGDWSDVTSPDAAVTHWTNRPPPLTGLLPDAAQRAEQARAAYRHMLCNAMHTWVAAIHQLWAADPRPLPLPRRGYRRL